MLVPSTIELTFISQKSLKHYSTDSKNKLRRSSDLCQPTIIYRQDVWGPPLFFVCLAVCTYPEIQGGF